MKYLLQTLLVLFCLVVLSADLAYAQARHHFVIRDGIVTIDGRRIPKEDLPAVLPVDEVELSLSYVDELLLELNDTTFLVDGQGIRVATDLDNSQDAFGLSQKPQVQYFLGGGRKMMKGSDDEEQASARVQEQASARTKEVYRISAMQEYADSLRERALELERLHAEARQQEVTQVLEQAQRQTQKAAEIAEVLPQLEIQRYFESIQREDEGLYGLLIKEWQMEQETQFLAQQIRMMPEGKERNRVIGELLERLESIFELKQQNRRREIKQLEEQLAALKNQMKKREALRQKIIELRLQELTGIPSPPSKQ